MSRVAIVLAAGSASRFGSNKLAARLRGEPLLHHAIRAARAAPVDRVLVVCRPGLDIGRWDGAPPVEAIELSSSEMSASLRAGIEAAGDAASAFIFLGDMPLVPHGVAGQLAENIGDQFAALPRHEGRTGHPVLLSARSFTEIARLTGDQGAAKLLRGHSDLAYVDCSCDAIHLDVDRPEDLAALDSKGDPPAESGNPP